jgi:hypothetical protein
LIAKVPKNASYPTSVSATFDLAIKKATEDCPEAERLMGLISFFAPNQIPLWLIPDVIMSETARSDALAALESLSLLAFDNAADGTSTISVHRLVQEVARGRLETNDNFQEYAEQAARALDEAYKPGVALLLPHAKAICHGKSELTSSVLLELLISIAAKRTFEYNELLCEAVSFIIDNENAPTDYILKVADYFLEDGDKMFGENKLDDAIYSYNKYIFINIITITI